MNKRAKRKDNMSNKLYTIKFNHNELDRIWYVFGEELTAHTENVKNGYTGYEGCLNQTKDVIKRLKPIAKKLNLYSEWKG